MQLTQEAIIGKAGIGLALLPLCGLAPQPASAQVVYQDSFTSGTVGSSLNGNKPQVDLTGATYLTNGNSGNNDVVYNAGSAEFTGSDTTNVFLPFTLFSAGFSSISADVTPASGSGRAIELGFADGTSGDQIFMNNGPVLQMHGDGSYVVQNEGVVTASGLLPNFTGTATLNMTYNSAIGTADFFVDGSKVDAFTYTTTPTVTDVFLTQYSGAGAFGTSTFTNLKVTNAPVPEASTTVSFGLLLCLGLGGMVWNARRKKAQAGE